MIPKNHGRESANGDFQCAKLESAEKFAKKMLVDIIKAGTYVNQYVQPYICTKFGGFSFKNEPRNVKEPSSLNGPLRAYLMRQNLQNQTCPRFINYPWKITDVRALTEACPPCRPPDRSTDRPSEDNTPEPLRTEGHRHYFQIKLSQLTSMNYIWSLSFCLEI